MDNFLIEYQTQLTVRSTDYIICCKKYQELTIVDRLICTILRANGPILTHRLAGILGLNIIDDAERDVYRDLAEESVFRNMVATLKEFGLVDENNGIVFLTSQGKIAIETGRKFLNVYFLVNHFDLKELNGLDERFSFANHFSLSNKIIPEAKNTRGNIIDDAHLASNLQGQIFNGDSSKFEITRIQETNPNRSQKKIAVDAKLQRINGIHHIAFILDGSQENELSRTLNLKENSQYKQLIVEEGGYQFFINSTQRIGTEELERYQKFWDYNELAKNKNIAWEDAGIFQHFKRKANTSGWEGISEFAPLNSIRNIIEDYQDYLHWRTLTKRFDLEFIRQTFKNLPWDLEHLSAAEPGWVIPLLTAEGNKRLDWKWSTLSLKLPEQFILDHIEDFPWDYHAMTSNRFGIFKTLFSDPNRRQAQLSHSWDWTYIFKEIKIGFLYHNLSSFGDRINWEIVLHRFFNDEGIISMCLADNSFANFLRQNLPLNFMISHQDYTWNIQTLDFFDSLNRINWETRVYIRGIDTSPFIHWNQQLLSFFRHRITTDEGRRHLSGKINSIELLREFDNFNWHWPTISRNKALVGNQEYIRDVILYNRKEISLLDWAVIYPFHDISFWTPLLDTLALKFNLLHIPFWTKVTRDSDLKQILSNENLPWNWNHVSRQVSTDDLEACIAGNICLNKWDWHVVTKRISKEVIVENLEECCQYLDWKHLIDNTLDLPDLNLVKGQLVRIATCLDSLEEEKAKIVWKAITRKLPIDKLFDNLESTASLDIFKWDWDMISAHPHLPTDVRTLHRLKERINWNILSESSAIRKKFDYQNYQRNSTLFFDSVSNYLSQFGNYWDWTLLSQKPSLGENRRILRAFVKSPWDWEYLNEKGKFLVKRNNDKPDYLKHLSRQLPIKFKVISKRVDLNLTADVIIETANSSWDWGELSRNNSLLVTHNMLLKLSQKNWDWRYLTTRRDLELDNQLLVSLIDKPWDWRNLHQCRKIEFNDDFIALCLEKPLNWAAISNLDGFTLSLNRLHLLKDKGLDWQVVSQSTDFQFDLNFLSKFEGYLDWKLVTKNQQLDFLQPELLEKFKDRWDWEYLCSHSNLPLLAIKLVNFQQHLNWNALSANPVIKLDQQIIESFFRKWNWVKLSQNNGLDEKLQHYIHSVIEQSPDLQLVHQTTNENRKWGGYIYHFTHIDNAVDIINARKVQSRNQAHIKADAAGSVVNRRHDAHEYARFYFRPKTHTQFYNEFLGIHPSDGYTSGGVSVSWYEKARFLNHPKCPIPIFFRFNMQEVLFKKSELCNISNGNMQTGSTAFGTLSSMIGRFNAQKLFIFPPQHPWGWSKKDRQDYRDYAQQEFLIKDHLDFADIEDFQIICPHEQDRTLLISLLSDGNEDVVSKILVAPEYYNFKNPRISVFIESDGELRIDNQMDEVGYLTLKPFYEADLKKIVRGRFERHVDDQLIFKSSMTLDGFVAPFDLYYTDESGRKWFIYSRDNSQQMEDITSIYSAPEMVKHLKDIGYKSDLETKIDHYTLEKHTLLVCGIFERYFLDMFSSKELIFMRYLLLLHDIGKSRAYLAGDKSMQYEYTANIINDLRMELPFEADEIDQMLRILDGDLMGRYMVGKDTLEFTSEKLIELAWESKLKPSQLFYKILIYYQCDVAAYTADEGGLKFLEKLFEYQNGKKILVKEKGMLKFSVTFDERFKNLENYILHADQIH